MRLGLALVALAGVVAACSVGGGDQEAGPTFSPAPRGTVLGIVWQEDVQHPSPPVQSDLARAVLTGGEARAQRRSLELLAGRILSRPGGRGAARNSHRRHRPNASRRGFAAPARLRRPPEEPAVASLAWPTERRILALVEWGAWNHALVVIDPSERRIVSREMIEGTLVALARTHEGLALLLAPVGSIGPARLLLVDSAGTQRSVTLADVRAGLETIDPQRSVQRLAIPALAVDPAGARALVVPAAGPLAEVDLASERVGYHDVHEPVSLLGRPTELA